MRPTDITSRSKLPPLDLINRPKLLRARLNIYRLCVNYSDSPQLYINPLGTKTRPRIN